MILFLNPSGIHHALLILNSRKRWFLFILETGYWKEDRFVFNIPGGENTLLNISNSDISTVPSMIIRSISFSIRIVKDPDWKTICRYCTADWNSDQLIRESQTVFRVRSQRLNILQPIKDDGLPLLIWIYDTERRILNNWFCVLTTVCISKQMIWKLAKGG